jgi:hypothetical protein
MLGKERGRTAERANRHNRLPLYNVPVLVYVKAPSALRALQACRCIGHELVTAGRAGRINYPSGTSTISSPNALTPTGEIGVQFLECPVDFEHPLV